MSLRRALIWSLSAHALLVWITINDRSVEGEEAARPLAVRIASAPALTPSPNNSPTLLQVPTSTSATPASAPWQSLPLATAPTNANESSLVERRVEASVPLPEKSLGIAQAPSRMMAIVQFGTLNAEGLRGYRLALAREARRVWRYPAQAIDARWQGTTEIRLELLANGQLLAAHVEKSSGHALLDDAARAMMLSAASTTQIPPGLTGDSASAFAVVVPVKFSLANSDDGRPSPTD